MKVLCVAEKPSIAKSITGILSGGHWETVSYRIRRYRASADERSATRTTSTSRTMILPTALARHLAAWVMRTSR